MPPVYDAAFFEDRNAWDKQLAVESHDRLVVTPEHQDYRTSITYDDATIKNATDFIESLALKTQNAWKFDRAPEDVPEVEWELINCLNAPFRLDGKIINLMKVQPISYYPMSIASMGLRSLMTWMSRSMRSEAVREWVDTIKAAWGVIDSEHRKWLESKKRLEACRPLWERARKPPLGSSTQFVKLGRPPKGKRGVNRCAESWVRDRINGLTEDEADAAWKLRVAIVALRNTVQRTSTPCAKTIARRAWYKAAKEEDEARKDARAAAMYVKVERIRAKLMRHNFNMNILSDEEMDLYKEYKGVDLEIDDDERELIVGEVATLAKKTEKAKAKYYELAPPPKKVVFVKVKPAKKVEVKEKKAESEDSDFYDSDSD